MNNDSIIKQAEKEIANFLNLKPEEPKNSFPPEKSLGNTVAETNSSTEIYTWNDFINQETDGEGESWIVRDILRPGWLGVLGGHGKHGKTTLVFQLLNALRLGKSFISECNPTPVIYINCEMAPIDAKDLIKSITTESITEGETAKIVSQIRTPLNILELGQILTKEEKPGVCVIDSFRAAFLLSGDSENEAGTVGGILRFLQSVARKTHWTIIVIHHFRKSGKGEVLDFAGSGEWSSAPDVILAWDCPNFEKPGTLKITGRIPPTEPLSIKLSRDSIEFLGTKDENESEDERNKVLWSISDNFSSSDELAKITGLPESTVRRRLSELLDQKKVERIGEGVKGDPFLWRKAKDSSQVKQIENQPMVESPSLQEISNFSTENGLKPCYVCGFTKYWKHPDGRIICSVCHPPLDNLNPKKKKLNNRQLTRYLKYFHKRLMKK